jgi:hypothetical protein
MKKQILIALLLFVALLSFSHSAEVSSPPDGTGSIKAEWLEKIYQANRPIETAEIEYCVFEEDRKHLERSCVLWDPKKKLMRRISISSGEGSLIQRISDHSFDNGKAIYVGYMENRRPDLKPSFDGIKNGWVSIDDGIPELILKLRLFFIFDDDFGGNPFCNTLKFLSPENLQNGFTEIDYKGKKCLKFSGLFTIIFEKERGIILEKSIQHASRKEMPVFTEKIEYADHQFIDGTWFPLTVYYKTQRGSPSSKPDKAIYRMKLEDVKLNHKIPDEKFTPRIPNGFEVFDNVNELHYLSTGFSKERENAIKKKLDEIFEESEK